MFSEGVGHGGANHGHGQDQLRGYQDLAGTVWDCQCFANAATGGLLMRIAEIQPAKPLTPDQQRIRAMQARVTSAVYEDSGLTRQKDGLSSRRTRAG